MNAVLSPPNFLTIEQKEQVDAFNKEALCERERDPQRGLDLVRQALAIAAPDGADQPPLYPQGAALSWMVMGQMFLAVSNYGEALRVFLTSLDLSSSLQNAEMMARVKSQIGITFGNLGDYPQALDNLFGAMDQARAAHLPTLEYEIINNISYTYVLTGQAGQAVPYLETCIGFFRDRKETQTLSLAWALDSLAHAYLRLGDFSDALETILECVKIARKEEHWQIGARGLKSAGDIYIAVNDLPNALVMYQQAYSVSQQYGYRGEMCQALRALGEVYFREQDYPAALQALKESLLIAEEVNACPLEAECCWTISQVYKKIGNIPSAFEFFERYHDLDKAIFNAEADRRLKNLQVLRQVDTARKEAEVYRYKAQVLQEEIEEHKQMHAVLAELASTDSLTGLFNRRTFYEQGNSMFEWTLQHESSMAAIIFDIDLFKEVNDHYGHLAGDHVLLTVAQEVSKWLRINDLVARYGGEEFGVLLPQANRTQALQTAERLRGALDTLTIVYNDAEIHVTISLGVAAMAPGLLPQPHSFEELFSWADHALYHAKEAGRNRIAAYSPPLF
jgi:diguanylate cyclase (GGDEF)-like protein